MGTGRRCLRTQAPGGRAGPLLHPPCEVRPRCGRSWPGPGAQGGWGSGTHNRNFPTIHTPQRNHRVPGEAAPRPPTAPGQAAPPWAGGAGAADAAASAWVAAPGAPPSAATDLAAIPGEEGRQEPGHRRAGPSRARPRADSDRRPPPPGARPGPLPGAARPCLTCHSPHDALLSTRGPRGGAGHDRHGHAERERPGRGAHGGGGGGGVLRRCARAGLPWSGSGSGSGSAPAAGGRRSESAGGEQLVTRAGRAHRGGSGGGRSLLSLIHI